MICPNCGENFEGDAGFCPTCGAQIGGAQPQVMDGVIPTENATNNKKKGIIIGIIAAVVVAIIAIVCVVVLGKKDSDDKAGASEKDGTYVLKTFDFGGMEMSIDQVEAMTGEKMEATVKIDGSKVAITTNGEEETGTIKWDGNSAELISDDDGAVMNAEYSDGMLIISGDNDQRMIFEKR